MKNLIKSQNYKHYKLPITINPLEYGKLILKIDELKLFIVQINRTNMALIYENDEFNHIKFFREGNLVLEFKDHKYNNEFVRNLNNKKFTFKHNQLVTTEYIINRINLFLLVNRHKTETLNSTTLLYSNFKW